MQTLAEEEVLIGERGSYRLERSPSELHVPATVQGVLAARIDRLPAQEKDLLQTLAVIGKEFPLGSGQQGRRRRKKKILSEVVSSPGSGVHLRAAGVSGAGVHLQARTDAGGGVPVAAGGPARGAARAHSTGDRGAVPRRARRTLRGAGPSLRPHGEHPEGGRVPAPVRSSRRSSARPTRRRSTS